MNINNSEIAIVLSHANNPKRKKLLEECLQSIEIEKLVSCNFPLDVGAQKLTDWMLYSSDNDLLTEDQYNEFGVSYFYFDNEKQINLKFDHSYAAYNLIKNALLFCKRLGKDIVHIINYDYVIPPKIINEHSDYFKNNNTLNLLVYQDDVELTGYSTGFLSGKVDYLLLFFEHYKSKFEYYRDFDDKEPRSFYLEGKIKKFYSSKNQSEIKLIHFDDIKDLIEINRESLVSIENILEHDNQIEKNKSNGNINIYYHVCTLNDGLLIAAQQLHLMSITGLLYKAKSVNIGLKYDTEEKRDEFIHLLTGYNLSNNIKIIFSEIHIISDPNNQYELKTALFFKEYADSIDENEYILYLHTKGISHYKRDTEINTRLWRQFMEYFMITKWKDCVIKLNDGFETCGTFGSDMKHMNVERNINNVENENNIYYPGTFYWINTSLLKRIPMKYFCMTHKIENEYYRWSIEALPGLINHKQYMFSPIKTSQLYSRAIHPLSYIM